MPVWSEGSVVVRATPPSTPTLISGRNHTTPFWLPDSFAEVNYKHTIQERSTGSGMRNPLPPNRSNTRSCRDAVSFAAAYRDDVPALPT